MKARAYRRDGHDRRLGDRRVQLHIALLKVVHVDLDAPLHGDLARGRDRERVDRAPAARPGEVMTAEKRGRDETTERGEQIKRKINKDA